MFFTPYSSRKYFVVILLLFCLCICLHHFKLLVLSACKTQTRNIFYTNRYRFLQGAWLFLLLLYLPACIFRVVTSVEELKDLLLFQMLFLSLTYTHNVKYVPFCQDLLKPYKATAYSCLKHLWRWNGSHKQTLSLLQVCMYKCQEIASDRRRPRKSRFFCGGWTCQTRKDRHRRTARNRGGGATVARVWR